MWHILGTPKGIYNLQEIRIPDMYRPYELHSDPYYYSDDQVHIFDQEAWDNIKKSFELAWKPLEWLKSTR